MKRAADFNPVYPYETVKKPNLMPPFYSSNGFEEGTTTILSLNTADPLTTEQGPLSLKLGAGVTVNSNGELEATGETVPQAVAPLQSTPNGIALQTSSPLTTASDKLTVDYATPLTLNSDNKLSLAIGSGLQITSDGELATVPGATSSELPPLPPLTKETGRLGLRIGAPLWVNNNTLYVNTDLSMGLHSGALGIVKPRLPLDFTDNGSLRLNVGTGLSVADNNLNVNVGAGLNANDNSLNLNIGKGLILDNNVLTNAHTYTAPLVLNNGVVSLTIGSGLQVVNDTLVATGGASNEEEGGSGGGELQPVEITANAPLVYESNTLKLIFTDLFSLTNNSLTITDYTLWTTADPSPNVDLSEERSVKLWLSLTKSGSLVTGVVAVQGFKSDSQLLSNTPKTIDLVFTETGELDVANSNLKGTWGWKFNNSINPNSTLNALKLMPNTSVYPLSGGVETRSSIIKTAYLQSSSKPVILEVACNTLTTKGFSLEFKWSCTTNYDTPTFATTFTTFCYIAQE